MEKDQLISMIHFLEKRDEESKKENKELKELLKSLREEYREDAEQTQRLLKTIETLTQQVSDITTENEKLHQISSLRLQPSSIHHISYKTFYGAGIPSGFSHK